MSDVRALADTVLFEGYMLYPYRANDQKNRVRWQFGVLAPPAYAQRDPSERSALQCDCLVEGPDASVTVTVRFLHVQRRAVQRLVHGGYEPTDALETADATWLPWDEAVVHEAEVTVPLPGLGPVARSAPITVSSFESTETVDGGRLVRTRLPLRALLSAEAAPLPGPYGLRRLRLRLANETPREAADREEALRGALVAAHLLVAVQHGAFVSLIDPPEWARGYVDACEQVGAFPVLAGEPGARDLVLASPIILYDHPQVAPESPAQFCDLTEMDEMLTLRTMTLTDAEKRQARGSDPRAALLVDQVDGMPPELMERLHGAIRSMSAVARPAAPEPEPRPPWWDPGEDASVDPDSDFVLVGDVPVGRGSAVRLRPGGRRADAQDMFLDGRCAHVEAVLFDVDGGKHVAVTLDDIADGGVNPHGRFLYFAPDEIEVLA